MPATFDNTSQLIEKIPKEKVFILDRLKPDLQSYPVVYRITSYNVCYTKLLRIPVSAPAPARPTKCSEPMFEAKIDAPIAIQVASLPARK